MTRRMLALFLLSWFESEQTRDVQVVAAPLPGSVAKPPTLHFSVSDATGADRLLRSGRR